MKNLLKTLKGEHKRLKKLNPNPAIVYERKALKRLITCMEAKHD